MELSRKFVNKAGHTSDKRSESSVENSSMGVPAKAKSGRFRLHMRTLSNFWESRSLQRHQTFAAYENTYKLEPADNVKCFVKHAEQVIGDVFDLHLQDKVYDPNIFPRLIKTLVDVIKDRIKTLNLNRYKIITTVTVIQSNDQGVQISSRALWNDIFDNYASLTYEGSNFYAVGAVYFVYQD